MFATSKALSCLFGGGPQCRASALGWSMAAEADKDEANADPLHYENWGCHQQAGKASGRQKFTTDKDAIIAK